MRRYANEARRAEPGRARIHRVALRLLLVGASWVAAPVAASSEPPSYVDGVAAFDRGDYAAAIEAWLPLARRGDPLSQFGLGLIYQLEEPKGLADEEEALHWLRMAARQGSPPAQNNLAFLYAEGRGIPPDPELALHYWREAATAGYGPAQVNLARALDRGFGVQSDPEEAARWYRAAADQGMHEAQRALATLHRDGRGVPQDEAEARRWDEAAKAGEIDLSAASEAPTPAPAAQLPAVDEQRDAPAIHVHPEGEAAEHGPASAAEPTTASDSESGIYAQLASLPTADGAASAARHIALAYADAFAGLKPAVRRTDLGDRGIWFRVLVGPFADATRAHALCDAVRTQSPDADCLVLSD